jgi:hypothetical protein
MGGRSVPGASGRRIHPCGRDTWRSIRNRGDRKPGEPCLGQQRRNRRNAPTVRREVALGAVRVAQRLARRGELGIATVAMVVTGVAGGSDKSCRRTWKGQALAMACQRELGPEQRRHREDDGALEPIPMTKAGHELSVPLGWFDAVDPDQSVARSKARSAAGVFGEGGTAADLVRRSALATTDTELRLMASAATIGLSRIPNAG